MKKIIILICVIGLMLIFSGVSGYAYNNGELSREFEVEDNTLITEYGNNQTIEVDCAGNIVWQKTGLIVPHDAERLSNGNTLITEIAGDRVIEVDTDDNIVWQKTGLIGPMDVERLSNGNTLITEYGANRVIEINTDGDIVWSKTGLSEPMDAERLSNGNTLIVESWPAGRVIEVDNGGNIIWNKTGLIGPVDVERLTNGNTLIAEHVGKKVIEVDSNGNIIWQKTGLQVPKDVERLPNGNTLIAELGANRVIEVDIDGNIVWSKTGLYWPTDVERFTNQPPSVKFINPKEGYFHFSGISLFPTIFNLNTDTISLGGFRLRPVLINTTDDFDSSEDLIVKVYLNGNEKGIASYCSKWKLHEWFWTGFSFGFYQLKITAEDTRGNIGSIEMGIWNICFLP